MSFAFETNLITLQEGFSLAVRDFTHIQRSPEREKKTMGPCSHRMQRLNKATRELVLVFSPFVFSCVLQASERPRWSSATSRKPSLPTAPQRLVHLSWPKNCECLFLVQQGFFFFLKNSRVGLAVRWWLKRSKHEMGYLYAEMARANASWIFASSEARELRGTYRLTI